MRTAALLLLLAVVLPGGGPAARPVSAVEAGVPSCTGHTPTAWHPLVRRDGAGAIVCTYGHEHHDDPSAVNDIFGPPGAWAGVSGQSISYPWQTSSPAGPENQAKHEGYKWYVARDQPCRPLTPNDPARNGCFISWRVQVHSLGTASDAIARFHSFSLEAVVEHQGRRGMVRHGGWLDTGHLSLLADGGDGHVCPSLPTNDWRLEHFYPIAPDGTSAWCGKGLHREASSANIPPQHTAHNAYTPNWYTSNQGAQVGPKLEEWGPIDYRNPANQLFYPAAVRGNNSKGRIENMAVGLGHPWLAPYTDATGLVRFDGYTTRHGTPAAGCSVAGLDCVPFEIVGAPNRGYQFNANVQGLTAMPEHDVADPSTGQSLIRFPN